MGRVEEAFDQWRWEREAKEFAEYLEWVEEQNAEEKAEREE